MFGTMRSVVVFMYHFTSDKLLRAGRPCESRQAIYARWHRQGHRGWWPVTVFTLNPYLDMRYTCCADYAYMPSV